MTEDTPPTQNDDRIEAALDAANRSVTVHLQKQNLRHRAQDLLNMGYSGGRFRVTPELICFVDLLIRDDLNPGVSTFVTPVSAVLIDDYKNPIKIEDLAKFRAKLLERYHSTVNEYHLDYAKLSAARNPRQAVMDD